MVSDKRYMKIAQYHLLLYNQSMEQSVLKKKIWRTSEVNVKWRRSKKRVKSGRVPGLKKEEMKYNVFESCNCNARGEQSNVKL